MLIAILNEMSGHGGSEGTKQKVIIPITNS